MTRFNPPSAGRETQAKTRAIPAPLLERAEQILVIRIRQAPAFASIATSTRSALARTRRVTVVCGRVNLKAFCSGCQRPPRAPGDPGADVQK
jgi:hypothetical protein